MPGGGGPRTAEGSGPRRPRLRDVADEAGVSVTTVSVVLSGAPNGGIPARTQERVRKAARRLGYVPNFSAQSLRTKRSRTLGFITDGIATSPFAGEMIAGAQAAAWESGYVIFIVDTGELEELADSAARVLLERQVEGVIIASWFHRAVNVPAALRNHKPVLANCFAKSGNYAAFVPDEVGGGYAAARRLLQRKPSPIALINFDMGVPAGLGRLEGYRRALAEAGVPFDASLVLSTAHPRHVASTMTSGPGVAFDMPMADAYEQTKRLLAERPDVRMFFCYNDRSAMGAYEAVKEQRLRIPEDVAVIGFDNQTIIADQLMPGLTTVALPHYEMGQRAVEYALTAAHGQARRAQVFQVPCTVVERCSV